MITFSSGGGFGNRLFQYVSARLLAERFGFELGAEYDGPDTVTTTPPLPGYAYTDEPQFTITETAFTGNIFDKTYESRHYHLQGYWQNADYYLPNRKKVLGYFNEKAPTDLNKKDIVMHVRLGDYKAFGEGGNVLHPDYYHKCLKLEKFDRLYIVTDEPQDEYFETFTKYNPTIINGTEKEDFWFLTGFDRIIMGNSTFSWWAAFFSNAGKVYMPKCWIRNSIDLHHNLVHMNNNVIIDAGFKEYGENDV